MIFKLNKEIQMNSRTPKLVVNVHEEAVITFFLVLIIYLQYKSEN
jgi:hypothetical protein